MLGKLLMVAFGVWSVVTVLHVFQEVIWIARNGYREPEPCRKWYCPQTWHAWLHKQFPWL
jgi:hypothetical protein